MLSRISSNFFCLALATILYACVNEDLSTPQELLENDYMVSWIKEFGLVDSDQTWSVVAPVIAEVNPVSYAANATIYIYSTNPAGGGKLIGKTSSTTTLHLDVLKGTTQVFVQAIDDQGCCYENNYYNIFDGKVVINKLSRASRSASDITLGNSVTFAAGSATQEVREAYNASNPYTLTEAIKMNDTKYLWKKKIVVREITNENYSYNVYDIYFENIIGEEIIKTDLQYTALQYIMPTGYSYYGGFTDEEYTTYSNLISKDCNKRLLVAESPAVTYQEINGVEYTKVIVRLMSRIW